MRKRRTRYSERNTKFYNKGSHTVGQVVLSVAALFLVVIFLVVLCTEPLGNNGCGPSESMMTSGDAPETADSDVSQSNDASSDTAADTSDQTSGSTADNTTTSSDWRLLLVNSTHPLADDYSVDLTELRNGQSVDTRIL